jgi:FlaA1/EpsC-like NDP-sugar epimerase
MLDILQLIGRDQPLFEADLARHESLLSERVAAGRFLVIGGAGSIGQAVAREIFKRQPRVLHVVDISENNLVELVRDIRSTLGYIDGDFAPSPSTAARWSLAPCCAGRGAMIMC